ncbi:MAG: helix-turn-helix domain-containing protein [Spirochaetota bacterium]
MIERSFSRLPGIEAGATGRVSIVGTIRRKAVLTTRTTSTFDSYALVMLHSGRGTLSSGDHAPVEVTAGDLMLLFPGVPHEYGPIPNRTWDESYIVFSGALFDALESGGVITADRPVVHGLNEHWQDRFLGLIRLASKPEDGVLVRTPAPVYLTLLASFICEAVSAYPVHHVNPSDDRWLEEAYAALDAPAPMRQSLSAVADRLGTSYGSFVKRFTRLSGSAPGQTRTRIAMQHACRMLREGELTVSQVSSELGFSDVSYFCRRFRTYVGYSPTEFRHITGGDE